MRASTFLFLIFLSFFTHSAFSETRLINSNSFSSYLSVVSKAVREMVISGIPADKLRFNIPEELETLHAKEVGVFHHYQQEKRLSNKFQYEQSNPEQMADGKPAHWVFNAELEIAGMDNPDYPGVTPITAYLIGIKKDICETVNANFWGEFKVDGVPQLTLDQSTYYTKRMIDDGKNDYETPMERRPVLSTGWYKQPFGCFESHDGGTFVYYQVILER